MKPTTVLGNLRRRRRRARLTQTDLAAAAGLTQYGLSLIERGLRRPRPATVARIEAALRTLAGRG